MTGRLQCPRCTMTFRIVNRQHKRADTLRCEDCLLPYQCRDVEPPRRCLLTVRRADYERWAGVMPLQSWRDVERAA